MGSGPNGEMPVCAGVDFIIARDGKIAALYVYLDPPAQWRARNLFGALVLIVVVQGGPFRLKVFNGLRDQGQRELIFDGGPQVLKRHKLPVDGIAPVAHGVSPHLCGNPTNVGSFLFPFILLPGHWRSSQSAIRLCARTPCAPVPFGSQALRRSRPGAAKQFE